MLHDGLAGHRQPLGDLTGRGRARARGVRRCGSRVGSAERVEDTIEQRLARVKRTTSATDHDHRGARRRTRLAHVKKRAHRRRLEPRSRPTRARVGVARRDPAEREPLGRGQGRRPRRRVRRRDRRSRSAPPGSTMSSTSSPRIAGSSFPDELGVGGKLDSALDRRDVRILQLMGCSLTRPSRSAHALMCNYAVAHDAAPPDSPKHLKWLRSATTSPAGCCANGGSCSPDPSTARWPSASAHSSSSSRPTIRPGRSRSTCTHPAGRSTPGSRSTTRCRR